VPSTASTALPLLCRWFQCRKPAWRSLRCHCAPKVQFDHILLLWHRLCVRARSVGLPSMLRGHLRSVADSFPTSRRSPMQENGAIRLVYRLLLLTTRVLHCRNFCRRCSAHTNRIRHLHRIHADRSRCIPMQPGIAYFSCEKIQVVSSHLALEWVELSACPWALSMFLLILVFYHLWRPSHSF
jgi:hypothetical protein